MKKVKSKSLVVNIVLLFLILNIISLFLFSRYSFTRAQSDNLDSARDSILGMVKEKGVCIADVFDKIESNAELLGLTMENELMNEQSQTLSPDYEIIEDNTLVRAKNSSKSDEEQSNAIRPNTTRLTPELIREINATERLDKSFSKIVENDVVTWTYIVTKDNILRCTPYTSLPDYYNGAHAQVADDFYRIADEKNNPDKKVVWTKIYYDYLGKGWVKTCSRPVYDTDGELFGVVSIDVSVSAVQRMFFGDFMVWDTGKVCWADKEGNVIYHSDYSDITAEQGEKLNMNVLMEDMTVSKEKAMRKAFSGETGISFYTDNGSKMLVYTEVEGFDSVLYLEIDMDEFKASELMDITGIWIIIIIDIAFVIICAGLLYLYISRPLKRLMHQSEQIAGGNFRFAEDNTEDSSVFYEISSLNKAFQTMNKSIQEYTDNLLERNRELSIIMASIDETLMISDLDGNVELKAQDKNILPREIIKRGIDEVLRTMESYEEQIVLNGEVYRVSYYPVFNELTITSVVISSACITKNVLIEKELQQIEKMAGVGQLAAAIVHELKNSLALINGATYILGITTEENSKEVKTIKDAVMDAENIIHTLLDYSQMDDFGVEAIHIRTVISQILLLAKKEMISKGITVEMDVSNDCYINSSGRSALKVILQNIILNAIQQFTEEGKIIITAAETEDTVSITITDTAGGIALSDKESIFEPFITAKEEGHGIGLWITKQLVDGLNGTINVSEPENGMTSFTIDLPKSEKEDEEDGKGTAD
ncbi:MAG: ATP-binding protein [Emergencia sp.]